jgi:hypothetical protein
MANGRMAQATRTQQFEGMLRKAHWTTDYDHIAQLDARGQAVRPMTKLGDGSFGDGSAGPLGRLHALTVFHSKYALHGAFVWARGAINSPKWRFPARAVYKAVVKGTPPSAVHQVQPRAVKIIEKDKLRSEKDQVAMVDECMLLRHGPPGAFKRPSCFSQ